MVTSAPNTKAGAGKKVNRDHRTDRWRKKWKVKRNKELQNAKKSGTLDLKRAALVVKAVRRAVKKGKAFEVRKTVRKLGECRETEPVVPEKISKLESTIGRKIFSRFCLDACAQTYTNTRAKKFVRMKADCKLACCRRYFEEAIGG